MDQRCLIIEGNHRADFRLTGKRHYLGGSKVVDETGTEQKRWRPKDEIYTRIALVALICLVFKRYSSLFEISSISMF